MNTDLARLVAASNGVVSRADVLAHLPHHVLDHAVAAGRLVRLHPRTYVDPARRDDPWVRACAALRYAGPGAALSHLTALAVWGLPGAAHSPVHVLVPADRRPRGTPGVRVHRRRDFRADRHQVRLRRGLSTCRVERSVVDSWRLLPPDTRRAAVIGAVSERLTTPARCSWRRRARVRG